MREHLRGDPLSGAWFVFRGKRGDRLKILYWDGDGFALWQKRLAQGAFEFPKVIGAGDGSRDQRDRPRAHSWRRGAERQAADALHARRLDEHRELIFWIFEPTRDFFDGFVRLSR